MKAQESGFLFQADEEIFGRNKESNLVKNFLVKVNTNWDVIFKDHEYINLHDVAEFVKGIVDISRDSKGELSEDVLEELNLLVCFYIKRYYLPDSEEKEIPEEQLRLIFQTLKEA